MPKHSQQPFYNKIVEVDETDLSLSNTVIPYVFKVCRP